MAQSDVSHSWTYTGIRVYIRQCVTDRQSADDLDIDYSCKEGIIPFCLFFKDIVFPLIYF